MINSDTVPASVSIFNRVMAMCLDVGELEQLAALKMQEKKTVFLHLHIVQWIILIMKIQAVSRLY